jgi:hypothetical protein
VVIRGGWSGDCGGAALYVREVRMISGACGEGWICALEDLVEFGRA